MAKLQMQRIYIYALKKDRKPILEKLQRFGVVEVDDIIPEDDIFNKADVSKAIMGFEKNIATAREAVEVIERYVKEKKSLLASLKGKKTVSTEEYDNFKHKYPETVQTAGRILSYEKKIAELKAEISRLEAQTEMLLPWTTLDIPLNFSGTKHTRAFIGCLPKEWSQEDLYAVLAEYMPLNIDIISSSKEQTCIFVLCSRTSAEGVYEALRRLDFSLPSISTSKPPAEKLNEIRLELNEKRKAVSEAEKAITELAKYKEDLLFLQDYERIRVDKYEVIGRLAQSKNVFILTGYIPVKDKAKLEAELMSKYLLAIEYSDPAEDEDVPILLKNNWFARPLEGVLEGFSLPGKSELDPTMAMALFYYMLFGIMLSDAGYGLIMAIACGFALLKYRNNMESSLKNSITMFFYCGISTVFWGFMFGSFFGDAIDVIASVYFGVTDLPVLKPIWFVPMDKPMAMLTFSMALGLVHLMFGLIMKVVQLIRQKDYTSIIYDALSWFCLVISCTVLLLSMEMIAESFNLNLTIPPLVTKIFAVLAVISALIIVATNGRESKNPFKRFLKGLYALYGITSYLSDVLSYSRLLALGLATGVICNVVNKMASMAGGTGVVGTVIFIIILLVGHALNIAINVLGAYVHTIRLNYVEFFGKFYEGGGKAFNPFKMKTKYYKVKERIENEV